MTTVTLALTSADQSGMYILLEQNHNWIKRFFGVSIHLLSCICLFTSVKPKTSCVHTRIHRPRFGSATDLCWSDRCCPTLWSWRFHKTQRWKSFMWFIHTHLQTPQRSLSLPVSRSHIRNLQNIPIMSVQNFPLPFRIPSSKRLSDVTPQRWNRSVLELRLHETEFRTIETLLLRTKKNAGKMFFKQTLKRCPFIDFCIWSHTYLSLQAPVHSTSPQGFLMRTSLVIFPR